MHYEQGDLSDKYVKLISSMMLKQIYLLSKTLLLTLMIKVCAANQHPNISDVERLIDDKLKGYNTYVRPKINQSELLAINMGFDLIAIKDFDEVSEKFSVVGTLYMVWKDERMPWNPADYGNLIDVNIERGDFWVPPFILVNAFDKFEMIGKDSYWPIRLHHSGYILYQPGQVISATCSVNVEMYPFDTQSCYLWYAMWGYRGHEVQLRPYNNSEKVTLTHFSSNGEWDLIDTRAQLVTDNIFGFQFDIRRKPLFIIVNTLIPIIFMSILNIFAFLIPIESGERISYCITVLLAVAVFLTIIADSLPQSATTIAVLSYYLVCVLGLSMAIIFGSIVSMATYFRDDIEEVPRYWQMFVNFMRCRICKNINGTSCAMSNGLIPEENCKHSSSNQTAQALQNGNKARMKSIAIQANCPTIDGQVSKRNDGKQFQNGTTRQNGAHSYEKIRNDKCTWKDVSRALDSIFMVISVLAVIFFTTSFFVYIRIS